MRLVTRIASAMSIILVMFLVASIVLLQRMSLMNDMTERMNRQGVALLQTADDIALSTALYRISQMRHVAARDAAAMKKAEDLLAATEKDIASYLTLLPRIVGTPEGVEAVRRYTEQWDKYLKDSQELMRLSIQPEHREKAISLLLTESQEAFEGLKKSLDYMGDRAVQGTLALGEEAAAVYRTARIVGLSLLGTGIVLGMALLVLIVRATHRQLGKDPGALQLAAERVINGDFDIDDGSEKIGVFGSLVHMVKTLRKHMEHAEKAAAEAEQQSSNAQEALRKAQDSEEKARQQAGRIMEAARRLEKAIDVISSAASQLESKIEQSNKMSERTAARLNESAAAMNQMNSSVQEVARNASSAAQESDETRKRAQSGAEIVNKALDNIRMVHETSLTLKEDMARLGSQAQNISQIMAVISDIADQTNLLALNAAIEAARAGEAGRGFAVVADEVRKLAEKTISSTADVGSAIRNIQESAAKSIASVENAVTQIEQASSYAGDSGAALESIVSNVTLTADQVEAIAAASEEQSASSEQINRGISEVNEMSSQVVQIMSEAARAVAALAEQASELTALVAAMRRGEHE